MVNPKAELMEGDVPKVSVCIPVRNGAEFLSQAVSSVLDQAFRDFELIIIDNASTDGTAGLAEEMAANNAKVRLFKNEHDIGLVANFNECLKHSRGEFIKFLCADDFLMPGCLEKMAQALDGDASVSLVVGGRQIINKTGKALSSQHYSKSQTRISGVEVINRCLFGTNYIGEPSAVMFRKSAALRGFREEFAHLMDMDMWFHILEIGEMMNLPESLCSIRRHAGQMTAQNIKTSALVEDNVRLFEEYGNKTYIRRSWMQDMGRKVRMAYRVWLCRDHLDDVRRNRILTSQSIPVVYHVVMPVLAVLLSRWRHTHLLER